MDIVRCLTATICAFFSCEWSMSKTLLYAQVAGELHCGQVELAGGKEESSDAAPRDVIIYAAGQFIWRYLDAYVQKFSKSNTAALFFPVICRLMLEVF